MARPPQPAAAPRVARINPNVGAVAGGDRVEVSGTENLVAVEWVKFGDTEATEVEVISPGLLEMTSPKREEVGPVKISVKTYHDEEPLVLGTFTYL
jgi:IPT/TIG domain-containing protein